MIMTRHRDDPLLGRPNGQEWTNAISAAPGTHLLKLAAERLLFGPVRTARRRDSVSSELTSLETRRPNSIVRKADSRPPPFDSLRLRDALTGPGRARAPAALSCRSAPLHVQCVRPRRHPSD
jgi:hypothetical protein